MTTTRTARPSTVHQSISPVIYVRLSADRNGTGEAVDRQEEAARQLAAAKGWPVQHLYNDNDRSATRGIRPDFERLLADIEAGRVDAVIVWHLDRLVRTWKDMLRLLEVGQPVKLNIACVQGVSLDLSDPTGIAVAQIITAIAGMEVAHKGERQAAANAQRAELGRPGALRAFGYNTDGSVREEEAALLKEMFTRFANGAPIRDLTKMLDESGIRGVTANKRTPDKGWSRTGVRSMLLNRRYIGELFYRGEYAGRGDWQPLIDPDLFAACGARLADPTRTTTTSPAKKWLGSGLFLCGACRDEGQRVTVEMYATTITNAKGERVRYRYYKCANSYHMVIQGPKTDEEVKLHVVDWLKSPKVRKAVSQDRNILQITKLRDEATALRAKEVQYALEREREEITARQNKVLMARLNERLEHIERELGELGKRSALAAVAGAADPGEAWLELDIWQQGDVLDAICEVYLLPPLGKRNVFDPARVDFAWRVRSSNVT